LKKRLKLWINWLKSTDKKSLKQRLDFPFEKLIETIHRLPKIQGQEIDPDIEKDIKTMDRLPKIHSKKMVETTVRFSI